AQAAEGAGGATLWPGLADWQPAQAPVEPVRPGEPPQEALETQGAAQSPTPAVEPPPAGAQRTQPAPEPAPSPAAAPAVWEEPVTGAFFSDYPEAAGFDPAAVIMQGRESASFEDEVAGEAEQADTSLELLCFRVATEDDAISIMDIKEIIKPREVTEVPRVPAFVRGILSLRGIIIPVFDMRVRLGLPQGVRSERERVVVVKRQSGFCGVLVDEVVQVVRIPETGIEPPPVVLEGIDRDFVAGIGRVAGRMLILLDMEKVLDVGLL